VKRALFLASGAALLSGCDQWKNSLNEQPTIKSILTSVEPVNHAVIGTRGMAKLYRESDVDREFRVNGLDTPSTALYTRLVAENFSPYKLVVDGDVERKQSFTLPELRALQSLTQITRHDCVEGWSAIGKWSGVPLGKVLALVQPTPKARYVVFHCYDADMSGTQYYESLNLHQAAHPQTILALDLNDKPLDPDHGAPVRLRVPTQLGYKSAKWVNRLELVADFNTIGGGQGGYWEDSGYEWYAGI
jgi:DMSO/TMAO reductase YedYZ molybdopterin-dependent catalytic subunit